MILEVFQLVFLVFIGFLIGYPIGHIFGKREALSGFEIVEVESTVVREARERLPQHPNCRCAMSANILDAEVIE